MRPRTGKYMHTAMGSKFWPMDPRVSEIDIETIAHHLACQGRYNGATQHRTHEGRIFYSVAEHSVYTSYEGPDDEALERLLHDAAEAYIGDLIRPLKYDPAFAAFKGIEERVEVAIAERFKLRYPWPASVKLADEAVTDAEVRQIIVMAPDQDWEVGRLHDNANTADIHIAMWAPHYAKQMFLRRYEKLVSLR